LLSKKNDLNIANNVTLIRIMLVPFFIMAVIYSRWKMALVIFFVAAITDLLDGIIARSFNQKTELGKILDPIADKLLIVSAFICLSVSENLPPSLRLPAYVPIIVISRDALIGLGSLVIHLTKGSLKIKSTMIGKVTTFFQMATVLSVLLRLGISAVLWNIAVFFTLFSGVDYIHKGVKQLYEKTS
jgi:cardiolipin synthase